MDLLHADTEEQVTAILGQRGYWDDPDVWRNYGGKEGNYSTMGNQSSSADSAIVEKLVNSVDAVLMGECGSAGIHPNSDEAPRSIEGAVAQFIFGDLSRSETLGRVSHWSDEKRREISNRITLAATGSRRSPSFTIVDNGEGQTPQSMPDTILSLDNENKVDVHFVQGKFNMGGSAALRFCGRSNLQLVISRRNPQIPPNDQTDPSSNEWGFTVVRRENPTTSKRVSTYTYLAPASGGLLTFDSATLPLFPEGNDPYTRETVWGTAIKLYEYRLAGRSHILRRDGLLYRLDVLLPGIALPVRLHECRDYSGHRGSFDTTLTGLSVRLTDDRTDNLEPGFPTSSSFTIESQQMTAEVYAFKRGKAETYRKREGIIFTVNGQTHGNLQKNFFGRKSVGMGRLEDSILVVVDCSRLSGRSREDLFMNSRDRMEQGDLLRNIERELEVLVRDNQLLRGLRERRRREDVEARIQDDEPFRDMLESILRRSPALAALFSNKGPLSDPFRSEAANTGKDFIGKRHPSFFRFRSLDYGERLNRSTAINMRSRVAFETDVENDYFTRGQFPGSYTLRLMDHHLNSGLIPDHSLNLQNGAATLNLTLPSDVSVGDAIDYELAVRDETVIAPFVNTFTVTVNPFQKPSSGGSSQSKRPKANENGNDSDSYQGLAIPSPLLVYKDQWGNHSFDKYSAVRVIYEPAEGQETEGAYSYYINMDNVYLLSELKGSGEEPETVKKKWQFGMVLIALALLRESERGSSFNGSGPDVTESDSSPEQRVFEITAALSPVLLPLIEHLGALSEDELLASL